LRILHVHSGNLYGGVETCLLSLARFRALAPTLDLSFALTSDGRIAGELRRTGVPVALLGETRLSRPLSVWRASIPLVLWMHMIASRFWLDRLAWRVQPRTVICNSRFVASTLPASDARIEIAYCPIALDPSTASLSTGLPRHRWKSEGINRELVIIQVSRMEPLKGQSVLIDALGRLRDRGGWTCWLAGGAQRPAEEQYVRSLRAQAARLGIADRVTLLGHRSDITELLATSDIYCQPNTEPEGFGLTLIVALAAGLPVVTAAVGGALEIVYETCGVLVAPRDAAALASELASLLDDRERRARLGACGPSRARVLCDPAARIPEIARVLETAARQ
jgi:glycosyltransferase involved in cell wall biosynthesis